MNLKRIKLIGIVGMFLLAFPFHFLFDWYSNPFTSIFFPVNESIWEHMKLLFSTIFFYQILEYGILHYFKIPVHNFFWTNFISGITGVILYLILYLPIHYYLRESLLIHLIILFFVITVIQMLSIKLLQKPAQALLNFFGIIGLISAYLLFAYFTYQPIHHHLFWDSQHEKYGINNYQ